MPYPDDSGARSSITSIAPSSGSATSRRSTSSFAHADAPRRLARVVRSTASFPGRVRGVVLPRRRAGRRAGALPGGDRLVRARRLGHRRRRPRQRTVPPRARGDPAGARERPRPAGALLRDALRDVARGAPRDRAPTRRPRRGRRGGVQPAARRHAHRDAEDVADYKRARPQPAGLARDARRPARRRRSRRKRGVVPRRLPPAPRPDVRRRRAAAVRRGHRRPSGAGRARAVQRPARRGPGSSARGVRLPWIPAPAPDDGARGGGGWRRSAARASVLDLLARTLAITPNASSAGDDASLARIVEARYQLSGALGWVRLRREAYFALGEQLGQRAPSERRAPRAKLSSWNGAELDYRRHRETASSDDLGAARRGRGATGEPSTSSRSATRRWSTVAHALGEGGAAAIDLLRRREASRSPPEARAGVLTELGGARRAPGSDTDEQRSPPARSRGDLRDARSGVARPRPDAPLHAAQRGGSLRARLHAARARGEALRARLGHFASFYKGSWRANDWMWGRMDGASRLVDILLDAWAIRLELESPMRRSA